MSTASHIIADGRILPLTDCAGELAWLAETNHTYRILHTIAHRPLHLTTQLRLLTLSYSALFRCEPTLDGDALREDIGRLLYRVGAPSGSNTIKLAAAADPASGKPRIFIFYQGPLIYPGYRVWHKAVQARTLPYEVPFPAFKTAAGLLCHTFAQSFARSEGYDRVLTVDYRGRVVSAGDNPVFFVAGNVAYTADAESQSPQSVERLMGMEICTAAGLSICEEAPSADSLASMDEIFAVTPQGILPVGAVDKRLYVPTLAKTFGDILEGLAGKEFI
ncbi:MAG: aminotransferase class IV [Alistipes sp.]|nr:aminotransferase class IV [Alistipes sp.]